MGPWRCQLDSGGSVRIQHTPGLLGDILAENRRQLLCVLPRRLVESVGSEASRETATAFHHPTNNTYSIL